MTEQSSSNPSNDPKPSDARNGCFLDSHWACKVCDGEIPGGHTDVCDMWKQEKKLRDFIANEYNAVLIERDRLRADYSRLLDTAKTGGSDACITCAAHVLVITEDLEPKIERARRIMERAISWLQIKEAAFATAKGPSIIEEMQRFCARAADETDSGK